MSASMVAAPQAGLQTGPRAGEAGRELACAAAIAGGILSFSALALGSIQFCKFSAAALGPGAFMFSIVKNLGGALAPFLAVAGATGAVLGLSAAWLQRDRVSNPRRLGFGASAVVLAGLAAAAVNAVYTPPEQRRRGYATAAVAVLSQRLLDTGYQFCCLFTDLSNPTSNTIYQRIGYRPLCDYNEYIF